MVGWRSFKGLANPPHFIRYLMAKVLARGVEGPVGAEVPEAVVCKGSPSQSTLGQEEQVHFGLPVELKDPANAHPLLHGLRSHTPLYGLPALGEAMVEKPEARGCSK